MIPYTENKMIFDMSLILHIHISAFKPLRHEREAIFYLLNHKMRIYFMIIFQYSIPHSTYLYFSYFLLLLLFKFLPNFLHYAFSIFNEIILWFYASLTPSSNPYLTYLASGILTPLHSSSFYFISYVLSKMCLIQSEL